jgi:hypothetical protein
MGHGQPGLSDALLLEQDDVEVEGAWTPTHFAHAPGTRLDPLELGQQVTWRKLGFYRDHLIEEWTLRHRSDRSGLFGVRLTQHPRSGECRDRASSLSQKYLTLAEVGA